MESLPCFFALPSGLRVVVDPVPHLETVALGLWVKTGSRNENARVQGISHALEHMVFKGTTTRTARQIAEDIENVGGWLNAWTSREMTAFHARALKQDVRLAMAMVADLVINPVFPDEEWQKEKGVIHQEIGQSEDTPDDIIFDHAQSTAFPGHPLGRAILGTCESVSGLGPDLFRQYMNERYTADRSVFVISGGITPGEIRPLVEEIWGSYGTGQHTPASPCSVPDSPACYTGGTLHVDRDLEQLHMITGFQGISSGDVHERMTVNLMSAVLGGGMSSRLFQSVREKKGLAYSVYSFHNDFQDTGFFGIYAGTGPEQGAQVDETVHGIVEEIKHTVTTSELARSQAQMIASLMTGLESPRSRCESLAFQMLNRGRIASPRETADRVRSVTLDDIHAMACRIFSTPSTRITLGPKA